MTEITRTFAETRQRGRGRVGLVPTMGFFHEGHSALMAAARAASETVVVSHFVNPLQFNDRADLERYPRDLDRDLEIAREQGVDLLFVPRTEEMYPVEPLTRVEVARVADHLEGPRRPGHFAGVATVVAKLFAGLQPDFAFFGRKDAQQLAVVRRLVLDLSFPVTVIGRPTLREADGLALSSRNVYLGPDDRPPSLLLSKGLFAAADLAEAGHFEADELIEAVRRVGSGIDFEYVTLASQDTAQPIDRIDRPSFLALAARIGSVRLIDNVAFDLVAGNVVGDRGIRLSAPSRLYS
ncbi:MAG: pantoate--beta-alanine ligase [Acidimicrobiia bacterium]